MPSLSPGRAAILGLLLAVFLGRIVAIYRVFNDTFDEAGHIRAGLEILQRRTFTIQAEQPPLGVAVLAMLPYYCADLRLPPQNELWGAGPWAGREPDYYWKALALARAGNLFWAAVLFGFVYLWSSRLFGARAGLAACLLVACSPNLIAHASLATLDIGAAATLITAAYFLWRWSSQPDLPRALVSAAAFAIAVLSKISAFFFLPPIAAGFFLVARRKPRLTHIAAFCALFFLILWAGYLFEIGALVPPGHGYYSPFGLGPETSAPHRIVRTAGEIPLPAHRFLQGIVEVLAHNQAGHRAYLLGRLAQHGWWYYFPVALAVKTTLPLLLLAAIALMLRPAGIVYPLLAAAAVLGLAMNASLNLGVRYVLGLYPLLAVMASAAFSTARPRVAAFAVILAAWHAGESFAAHPDYLPYFNQIARGREERFLLDSNLDWGQDLARLGRYTRKHGIERIKLSYFGVASPAKFGIHAEPLPPGVPQPGWIAVSLSNFYGLTSDPAGFDWLRACTPHARIGRSILLYRDCSSSRSTASGPGGPTPQRTSRTRASAGSP